MGSRINRAHDAKEDRAAVLAQAELEERTLASALQRLNRESVSVRDIMTMTGLGEKYVTRLLRTNLDADADADADAGLRVEVGRAAG